MEPGAHQQGSRMRRRDLTDDACIPAQLTDQFLTVGFSDDGDHPSLTGQIKRIESQKLTERLHVCIDRYLILVKLHAPVRMFDQLDTGGRQTSSGRIAQDASTGKSHRSLCLLQQQCTVTGDVSL